MKKSQPRTFAGTVLLTLAIFLSGCGPAHQSTPEEQRATTDAVRAADEIRSVAESALGKGAEVLARGDLAQDARDQLLIANPAAKPDETKGAGGGSIQVRRAAILEQSNGKWSEILLCDEHLKNPSGYLGGSAAARVEGWKLEYTRDPKNGLEMKFTPAAGPSEAAANGEQSSGANHAGLDVRWNKLTKRYQTFDKTHERFLTEVPSLETPQSTLR